MDNRRKQLVDLRKYINDTENEVTMLLQNLQWTKERLLEKPPTATCKYDANHQISEKERPVHEYNCYLSRHGYSKTDAFLPDPVDPNMNTVVKLNRRHIEGIINKAAYYNPTMKRELRDCRLIHSLICVGPEPLTAERLQVMYTADERRAIHDDVVNSAPFCHDLADLALIGSNSDSKSAGPKSRLDILAELRDMKRRRTKYRVAAPTANYSNVLRDVIKTQMELYAEAIGVFIKTEYGEKNYVSLHGDRNDEVQEVTIKRERESPLRNDNHPHTSRERQYESHSHTRDRDRHTYKDRGRNDGKKVPPPIKIKQERISPEPSRRHHNSRGDDRHTEYRSRDKDSRNIYIKQERDNNTRDRHRYRDSERHKYSSDYRKRHDYKDKGYNRDGERSERLRRDEMNKRYYDIVSEGRDEYCDDRKRRKY